LSSQAAERQQTITTADGVRLRSWLAAPANPIGVMLLCHGLATDATEHGAFVALRDQALRRGLAVARFDFRAHGGSSGDNAELRLAGLRADVEAVLALLDRELPLDLPLIPLGVSFGGAPAVHCAVTRSSCAGLALWYAVIDYRANFGLDAAVPFTEMMRAAADSARDPPWAEMPVVGTDRYVPKAMMAEMLADDTFTRLLKLGVPVLAYHGSRDTFVDMTPLSRLAAQKRNVDLRVARGAGHGFLLWRPWVIARTVWWAAKIARRHVDGT
jgi:pimeloyl-ACP methyl ester carboxylesterase